MVKRVRAHDWASTPLGAMETWPGSLRAVVDMMLSTPQAMCLIWGPAQTMIYNDGYTPLMGLKHPDGLGRPMAEVWHEVWSDVAPLVDRAMGGEAVAFEDLPLTMTRKGYPEETWWSFAYSPVRDETGAVAGMINITHDSSPRVLAQRRQAETQARLELTLAAGQGVGTWNWDVVSNRVTADARFAEMYGVDPKLAKAGAPLDQFFTAIHPDDAERVTARIQHTLATGSPFRSEYRLVQPDGSVRWVVAEGGLIRAEDGTPLRFPGVTFDITDRRELDATLAETETRYDALFNSTATGFCIVQMKFDEAMRPVDYMIVEGNPAYEEMTGLRGSTGKWVSEIAPGLEQHWFDLYGGVALTGETVRFENPADIFGRWYDVEALRIGAPEQHRVAILFTNITERKQTEARQAALLELTDALRNLTDPEEIAATSSAILARALNVTRAGYGVMDMEAETITIARDFNAPGMTSIAGTLRFRDFGSYIDDLAKGDTVVVTDTRADPRTADTAAALAGIGVASFINMPLKEQGRVVAMVFVNNVAPRLWTEADSDLLREFAARVRIAIERARAQDELADSEARYKTLFNEMDEGFCIIEFFDGPHGPDSDYIHVEANPAYAANAGIENVVGQKLREMVGDEADAWVERYGAVLRTGVPIRFEQELVATGRWLELSAFRVEPPERRQVAVLFQDLTERKKAEVELQSLNATLEERVVERTAELTRAHEALRQSQKMEAVGQLTGGIAHDFNNLLAGISGSLELLGKRLSEGRLNGMERYIDAAQGSAQRAASLTQRLLAFSRRQTLDPKPTDVNRLINGMEDLIRRSVGPDVEVEVVGAGGLWATKIDQSQLENALLNLCINARDAMAPAGGRLTIETSNKWLDDRAARARDLPPGQYVSLCVTDTGTGMPPEVQAQAFDPFFTTKPLGQGTGLGLSMIHGFVRQSGGQVRIYSEIGKGTTMCLYLPRYQGDVEGDEDIGLTPVAEGGHGETVLIIDDEGTVRMLVAEVLGDAGYNVIESPDGPSGLEILRSDRRIDLLISDVGLPGGMNGRQVADAARVSRPDLKVLFITGYAENAAVGNGLLAPGMEVLTKPFVMGDLAAKVHDMIEG